MPMTNKALQAIVAEEGDKIFAFILDNNRKIFFGVNGGTPENAVFATKLEFKTVEGVDMVGLHRVDKSWGTGAPIEIPFTHWLCTDFIQSIAVTDTLTDNLPDLNRFY